MQKKIPYRVLWKVKEEYRDKFSEYVTASVVGKSMIILSHGGAEVDRRDYVRGKPTKEDIFDKLEGIVEMTPASLYEFAVEKGANIEPSSTRLIMNEEILNEIKKGSGESVRFVGEMTEEHLDVD